MFIILSLVLLFCIRSTELDALELDMESESQGVPSYLQSEPDMEEELNLPSAPTAMPPGRTNVQVSHLIV